MFVHYQCFFLWCSSKQLRGPHLRQERLREHLYTALNPHIAIIKCSLCVKDLRCELAVKHHSKYPKGTMCLPLRIFEWGP